MPTWSVNSCSHFVNCPWTFPQCPHGQLTPAHTLLTPTLELHQKPHHCVAHKDASILQLYQFLQMTSLNNISKFHENQITYINIFSAVSNCCVFSAVQCNFVDKRKMLTSKWALQVTSQVSELLIRSNGFYSWMDSSYKLFSIHSIYLYRVWNQDMSLVLLTYFHVTIFTYFTQLHTSKYTFFGQVME